MPAGVGPSEPRLVEPDGPSLVLRAVRHVVVGLAWGVAVALGAALVLGVFAEEALPAGDLAADLDLLARTWAGVTLAGAGGVAVVWPLLAALERSVLLPRLERDLAERPADVALASAVARLAPGPTEIVGRLVATLGVCAAGAGIVLVLVTVGGADATTPPLLGCAGLVGLWLAVRAPLRRGAARWSDRVSTFRAQRGPSADAAQELATRRRHAAPASDLPAGWRTRWTRWLGVALWIAVPTQIVAVVLWFVPVVVRRPCRRCEPRGFGALGEARMDAASVSVTVLLVAATALLLTVLAARLVERARQERVVARWVADGAPRRLPDAVAADLLGRRRAAVSAARLLAVLAPVTLGVLLAAPQVSVPIGLPRPWTVAALPAAALLLALADARRGRRRRAALRRALCLGDDAVDGEHDDAASDDAAPDDPDQQTEQPPGTSPGAGHTWG
ncbi:hypothetical protein [Isoptericola aurantiacus]|uniref:hypothetical protein n=1 Tax=Isoptericola aurantiacus TaxID=3377839 RepID=UPI00383B7ECE